MRPPPLRSAAALFLPALVLQPADLQAADSRRCAGEVDDRLARLPPAAGEVAGNRIFGRTDIADDFGPEVFGVDAWIPTCHILQTSTRGDCRIEGVKNH